MESILAHFKGISDAFIDNMKKEFKGHQKRFLEEFKEVSL